MELDTDHLISLIEAKPVLWDKTLDIYKDRNATKNAWRDVCLQMNPDFESISDAEKNAFGKEVIRRWSNLRDAYARSKRDAKAGKKSGSEAKRRKKYVYTDQMQFLNNVYENYNTVDSMMSENEGGSENRHAEDEESRGTDEDAILPTATVASAPSNETRKRKHRKIDEVELKLLKALETAAPCGKMSFLQSLMPHLKHYTDGEFLQFQMGVLNVIQDINKRKEATPQPQTNYVSHMPSYHTISPSFFSAQRPSYPPQQSPSQIHQYRPQIPATPVYNTTPRSHRTQSTVEPQPTSQHLHSFDYDSSTDNLASPATPPGGSDYSDQVDFGTS